MASDETAQQRLLQTASRSPFVPVGVRAKFSSAPEIVRGGRRPRLECPPCVEIGFQLGSVGSCVGGFTLCGSELRAQLLHCDTGLGHRVGMLVERLGCAVSDHAQVPTTFALEARVFGEHLGESVAQPLEARRRRHRRRADCQQRRHMHIDAMLRPVAHAHNV